MKTPVPGGGRPPSSALVDRHGQPRAATIYDVAALAGVSHTTVSRVVNGDRATTPVTRGRVERAIAAVGYRPNATARALARNRSATLGVIVDHAHLESTGLLMHALERTARRSHLRLRTISHDQAHPPRIEDDVAVLEVDRVDALCLVTPRRATLDRARSADWAIPTTVIGGSVGEGGASVAPDYAGGVVTVVRHLAERGHRSILHLTVPRDWIDRRARDAAWSAALTRHSVRGRILIGDGSSDFGFAVGSQSSMIDHVTAVLASSDSAAAGLIHGLSVRGLRVPTDISVVGCGDLAMAEHLSPPLTTLRQDFPRLADAAIERVTSSVTTSDLADDVRVPMELIVRASTSTAARAAGTRNARRP